MKAWVGVVGIQDTDSSYKESMCQVSFHCDKYLRENGWKGKKKYLTWFTVPEATFHGRLAS